MAKLKSMESGNVAESLVMAELAMRTYIPARTERNAETFDILVTNRKGTKTCALQVKAIQNGLTFKLSKKNEEYTQGQDNCFYVFVSLANKKCERHRFYIVPFKDVAETIRTGHPIYLATPGKRVEQRKDTSMRAYIIDETKYKESDFSILGLD